MQPLVLASASPRRARILRDLGVAFEVLAPDVEELVHGDDPRGTVVENAVRKNEWACERRPGATVLTADTGIDLDGRLIGKPASREEAGRFLQAFAGRVHAVVTGVALWVPNHGREVRMVASQVRFRALTPDAIAQYGAAVDQMDKAGAYDIDQRGDLIIESFEGSRTNVMGLPAELMEEWIACGWIGRGPA
jgi:septum formation protein